MPDVADALSAYWAKLGADWESVKPEIEDATGWLVFNPIQYDVGWHELRLRTYKPRTGGLLIVGLNPGLYGMGQTGIPFTDQGVIAMRLKRLLQALLAAGKWSGERGQAPKQLVPYLSPIRNSENSSWPVYQLLTKLYGSAEKGLEYSFALNPCPLVFVDPGDAENNTPADLPKRVRDVNTGIHRNIVYNWLDWMNELRRISLYDAARILKPAGVLFLGEDVQELLRPSLEQMYDEARAEEVPVFANVKHPARASKQWVDQAHAELVRMGFQPDEGPQ